MMRYSVKPTYKKMVPYSAQPRDRIIIKDYEFLSFAKNINKNIHRNTSKNVSSKYSQKLFDHAKQSAADALKTASKRAIQKQLKQLVI